MWYQRKITIVAVSVLLVLFFLALLTNKSPDNGVTSLSKDASSFDYAKNAFLSKFSSNTKCSSEGCDRMFKDIFTTLTTGYRNCLVEKLKNKSAWKEMNSAITHCLGHALWNLLDVKQFDNRDDTKMAILPPADLKAEGEFAQCAELTLGVGRDIEAELLLRKAQPRCQFFGVDPIKSSGTVFKELGLYYELAVAAKAGVLKASIMEDGKYMDRTIQAVALVDLIKNYLNLTKIDFILIDNEGPEYELFAQLLTDGEIETNGISLCQLSAEFHAPFEKYNMSETKYDQLINSLLTNSSFLPIWSTINYHTRSFYVNVGDPYCVGKYFRSKWCGDFQYFKK